MEAGFIALIVVTTIIGIVVGIRIERRRTNRTEIKGDIYVYHDKSSKDPSLLLDCSVPIHDIASQKRVLFNVVVIK